MTAATSAVLFWLDHRRRTRERATRVSVAPTVGQGELGLAGEVRF